MQKNKTKQTLQKRGSFITRPRRSSLSLTRSKKESKSNTIGLRESATISANRRATESGDDNDDKSQSTADVELTTSPLREMDVAAAEQTSESQTPPPSPPEARRTSLMGRLSGSPMISRRRPNPLSPKRLDSDTPPSSPLSKK